MMTFLRSDRGPVHRMVSGSSRDGRFRGSRPSSFRDPVGDSTLLAARLGIPRFKAIILGVDHPGKENDIPGWNDLDAKDRKKLDAKTVSARSLKIFPFVVDQCQRISDVTSYKHRNQLSEITGPKHTHLKLRFMEAQQTAPELTAAEWLDEENAFTMLEDHLNLLQSRARELGVSEKELEDEISKGAPGAGLKDKRAAVLELCIRAAKRGGEDVRETAILRSERGSMADGEYSLSEVDNRDLHAKQATVKARAQRAVSSQNLATRTRELSHIYSDKVRVLDFQSLFTILRCMLTVIPSPTGLQVREQQTFLVDCFPLHVSSCRNSHRNVITRDLSDRSAVPLRAEFPQARVCQLQQDVDMQVHKQSTPLDFQG